MNNIIILAVSQKNVLTEKLAKFKELGFQTIKKEENLNAGSDFLKCLIMKLVQLYRYKYCL